jgi:hypothetical protein
VQDAGQLLPLELADLGEARASRAGLEPVLDVEDRGFILLAEGQPVRGLDLELFEAQLKRTSQRHRLVEDGPMTSIRRPDRLHLRAPVRIVGRIGHQLPHGLGWPCDLNRFLDPHAALALGGGSALGLCLQMREDVLDALVEGLTAVSLEQGGDNAVP